MKKILCLILAIIMVCGCLTACDDNATDHNKKPIDNSQGGMLEETESNPTSEENSKEDVKKEEQEAVDPAEITEYIIKVNNKDLKLPMMYKKFTETFDYEPMGIVSFGDLTPSKEYSTHGDFENQGDTTFYIRNTTDGPLPVDNCDVVGVMLFPGESIDILGIKEQHTQEDVKRILGEPTQKFTGANTVFSYVFPKIDFYGYPCFLEVVFDKEGTVDYIRYGSFDTTYSVNTKKEN